MNPAKQPKLSINKPLFTQRKNDDFNLMLESY